MGQREPEELPQVREASECDCTGLGASESVTFFLPMRGEKDHWEKEEL